MPATKKNTIRKASSKKTVIVTKSKVPAKSAAGNKLDKVNKMLSKTKWLDAQ